MKRPARQSLASLHWPFIFVVLAVALLGIYNLHSSAAAHAPRLYITQLCWCGLATGVGALSLSLDYRLTEHLAYIFYGLVLLMLVAVLGVGRTAMGARRWLELGPLRFQPSELAKLAVIVCLARYFSRRVPAGGFTIAAFARPLNVSRPLCCAVMLAACWGRPAVSDPLGELARGIYGRSGELPPQVLDLLWFRLGLLGLLLLGGGLGIWGVVRLERAASLLHPWPVGRRRQLSWAVLAAGALLALGLVLSWQASGMRDPIGAMLLALWQRGAPEGPAARLSISWGLRGLLVGGCVVYSLAAAWALYAQPRRGSEAWVAPLDLLLAPALLVLAQPDLGTASIIMAIGMTVVLMVGVRGRSLITLACLACLLSGLSWFGALKDYQKRRILTFIDPEQDLRGAGWNAVQSLIAVGSGRWAGKGHRGGTQTQLSFLPEQHTDFAFSVWAEEQGFVGASGLLLLYAALLWMAFHIASEARDTYGALLATGVAALVLWQVVINVGMVIGVLPVVGITLPLFSYGGSSTVAVVLSLALLLNIHWRRRVA